MRLVVAPRLLRPRLGQPVAPVVLAARLARVGDAVGDALELGDAERGQREARRRRLARRAALPRRPRLLRRAEHGGVGVAADGEADAGHVRGVEEARRGLANRRDVARREAAEHVLEQNLRDRPERVDALRDGARGAKAGRDDGRRRRRGAGRARRPRPRRRRHEIRRRGRGFQGRGGRRGHGGGLIACSSMSMGRGTAGAAAGGEIRWGECHGVAVNSDSERISGRRG